MRRAWILLLLARGAGAQEFSEAELDRAIQGIAVGKVECVREVAAWGPRARRAIPAMLDSWCFYGRDLRLYGYDFVDSVDDALRRLGPPAIPGVARVFRKRADTAATARARRLLEEFALRTSPVRLDEGLEGPILDLLDDEDALVRRAAAGGISTQGAAAVPKVLPLLADRSPRRRHGAACALAMVEPPPEAAMEALLAAATDADESVREAAVVALARVRPSPDGTRCFVTLLKDPADRVAAAAVKALGEGGEAAVPALIASWDDEASRAHAIEGLVRIGEPALVAVTEELRSGSRRRSAAACLGRMAAAGDLPVEPALGAALADPDAELRLAAAEALGIAPAAAARAIEALFRGAADPDPRVRGAAVGALARAAPADDRVAACLEKAKGDADAAPRLAAAAAAADDAQACLAVVEDPGAPVAARILAAERLVRMRSLPAALADEIVRLASDRALAPELRAAAADAVGGIAARRIFASRIDARDSLGTKGFRPSADRALLWLARNRSDPAGGGDGRWKGIDPASHDVGLTGLALLALLAGGHTDEGPGDHARSVRDGIGWLLSRQAADGVFREGGDRNRTLVEHAIATLALCELLGMTGRTALRGPAQRAVDACVASRGPYGWKYVARGPDSDTDVTTWMLTALRIADEVGLSVDPRAYEGACKWLDKVTGITGAAGYDRRGGNSSRPEGLEEKYPAAATRAMTAAAVWSRALLGDDPQRTGIVHEGLEALISPGPLPALPTVFAKEVGWSFKDSYYWYYAALATFQGGDRYWGKWAKELKALLPPTQSPDGSWSPDDDVWGGAGGRVYSTAMGALALLTPWRYPRGFALAGKAPPPYDAVVASLDAAAESPYLCLRTAARRALACCPGGR